MSTRLRWTYEVKLTGHDGSPYRRGMIETKAKAMGQGHYLAVSGTYREVRVSRWASTPERFHREVVQTWEHDPVTRTWRSNGRPFRPRL